MSDNFNARESDIYIPENFKQMNEMRQIKYVTLIISKIMPRRPDFLLKLELGLNVNIQEY